jgi:hypothetical protein
MAGVYPTGDLSLSYRRLAPNPCVQENRWEARKSSDARKLKDRGPTQGFNQPRALFTGDYTAVPVLRKVLLSGETSFYDFHGAKLLLHFIAA